MTSLRIVPVAVGFFAILSACGSAALAAGTEQMSDWYTFRPANDNRPGAIGMSGWLESPAGQHGGVRMVGDHFEFEDGTPVKFWGVNLGNMDCAPEKEDGRYWAERYAKYGINCIRLHKFTGTGWAGIGHPEDSTEFDPESLDRFDYFCARLKKHGVYYGWSHTFHHSVRPADAEKLAAYDEIVEHRNGGTYALVNVAEDVQNLRIEMVLNLLKHRNPYTGLTYAEDPALAFIEFQNEDCIFFYTNRNALNCPTYRTLFMERFSDWLKEKYGTHEKLVEAWGEKAMDAYEVKGEHLDRRNIFPQPNPWFMGPEGLAQAAEEGTTRRLLDTAQFMHHAQNDYYIRFRNALREAGYRGPLVGSCWRTAGGITMYYNLRSDYLVGVIDRHNYHGGLGGWKPRAGEFNNASQLSRPGGGLISVGFHQVLDRPFALSEWNTVFPNEWCIESPTIIGVYGMGLQGWDASYHFATHTREGRGFMKRLDQVRLWALNRPDQMGIYPAIARMVLRGDVQEGEVISTRRVHLEQLRETEPEFVRQERLGGGGGDIKIYSGALPNEAVAAGKVAVEFTPEPEESTFPDLDLYDRGKVIRSNTGQLAWDYSEPEKGFISVDTPATKALVGFVPDRAIELTGVTMRVHTPFAGLFLTALDRGAAIEDADSLLLVAMARARNTGMRFNEEGNVLEEMGTAPILLEPVEADIAVAGREVDSVRLLDHDGHRTDRTLPVRDGRFSIDGAVDKTFYYEVVLK